MLGMFYLDHSSLGAFIFRGFGLGMNYHGCGSVPAGFLTFYQMFLTSSSSASSNKLVGSFSPSAMIVFAPLVPA